MWPLFYVNFHSFPNSSIAWKLRFLNVGVRLYLHSLCTQKLKTGIFECYSKLQCSIFPNSWKRSWQHFQIFPNSQRDWKLRWLSVEKESSNEQEGMKVVSWIFNPLRTVNLNIFFSPVGWIFCHFRRVNSVSKNWMKMVLLKWLKLLAASEKTSQFF